MLMNNFDPGCADWRDRAIHFLLKYTDASQETIEHFVKTHWHHDASDDDNLDQFETYHSELVSVFSY